MLNRKNILDSKKWWTQKYEAKKPIQKGSTLNEENKRNGRQIFAFYYVSRVLKHETK